MFLTPSYGLTVRGWLEIAAVGMLEWLTIDTWCRSTVATCQSWTAQIQDLHHTNSQYTNLGWMLSSISSGKSMSFAPKVCVRHFAIKESPQTAACVGNKALARRAFRQTRTRNPKILMDTAERRSRSSRDGSSLLEHGPSSQPPSWHSAL